MDERTQERWTLPDHCHEANFQAFVCEVAAHIANTFGTDFNSLKDDHANGILSAVAELEVEDGLTLGRASCRGFASYVCSHGGEEAFALKAGSLDDWV